MFDETHAVRLFIANLEFIRRINRWRREYINDPSPHARYWHNRLTQAEKQLFMDIDLSGCPWNDEDEGHKHKLAKWRREGLVYV